MMQVPAAQLEQASQLWRVIELQKTGNIDEAISMWEGMRLPRETDHWRLLMLGVAYMQNAEFEKSAEALEESQAMVPDNPVAHYALGLLLLYEAEDADEWYDASGTDPFRLAVAPDRAPKTRSMHRLAAMMAFERAVALADRVNLNQPLLTAGWQTSDESVPLMLVAIPRVADAVEVFGGERFEGRSHLALALLHMHRDGLMHAEQHLDSAAELGEPTGRVFRQLGEKFEESNLPADAMRAHLKAFSHGGGAASLNDAWRTFGRLFSGE
jgi:tetratricopeptide (TPR) repeat protein